MPSKVKLGARLLLGVIYFVFGLNGFLQFLPAPPMPETAMGFLGGVMTAPYFFPVLKLTEVIGGLMLLSGFAAPLALVILAPITLQIFLFHAFLTPGLSNLVMPIIMIVLHVLAATSFWSMYSPMFKRQGYK